MFFFAILQLVLLENTEIVEPNSLLQAVSRSLLGWPRVTSDSLLGGTTTFQVFRNGAIPLSRSFELNSLISAVVNMCFNSYSCSSTTRHRTNFWGMKLHLVCGVRRVQSGLWYLFFWWRKFTVVCVKYYDTVFSKLVRLRENKCCICARYWNNPLRKHVPAFSFYAIKNYISAMHSTETHGKLE